MLIFDPTEPDSHRLGWGVAKFSGFLQDLEVSSEKDDSRCQLGKLGWVS